MKSTPTTTIKHRRRVFSILGYSERDHIFRILCATNKFYEIDVLSYMERLKKWSPHMTAIDVGANIGNHSIFFGNFIAESIIAIEANKDVIPILKNNLHNNCKKYKIYAVAAGSKQSVGSLESPSISKHNIGAMMVKVDSDKSHSIQGATMVKVTTIDRILENHINNCNNMINVGLLKLDIEGMELAALKGAKHTIKLYKPEILVEAQTKAHLDAINNYLADFGYKIISCWGYTPMYHFSANTSYIIKFKAKLARSQSHFSRLMRKFIRSRY